MAQWLKVPITKPDDFRVVPGIHMVEGEIRLLPDFYCGRCATPPPNEYINKQDMKIKFYISVKNCSKCCF